MESKVSVIVPVYNVREYLNRCVKSILNQEYRNLEVILVDDGSSDGSGELCDELSKTDERIIVIHQENQGVSKARNHAIDICRGEWIQFVDSDDWLSSDATKLLVREGETSNADLVISHFYRVQNDRMSMKGDIEDCILDKKQYATYLTEDPADLYYGVLWNKLYRTSIIRKHHLRMNEDFDWCEDFLFNLEYLRYVHTVRCINAPIYYYVNRKGSLVSQSMNLASVVAMKLSVFSYYQQFYEDVFDDEGDFTKLGVYKFLLDSAKDSIALPMIGSKKVDEDSYTTNLFYKNKSVFTLWFRAKRLMDRYFEVIAVKYHLSKSEIKVLYALQASMQSKKDVAEFAGMSVTMLTVVLSKLSLAGYIRIQNDQITFLDPSMTILKDLKEAEDDFDNVAFTNFSSEEIRTFQSLLNRTKKNLEVITSVKK